MSDQIRLKVVVSGRVQGVGYRFFAREQAADLNLSGWVQNLPGGQVELECQGPELDVERYLLTLEQGPCASRVEGLQSQKMPPLERAGDFHIRH